MTVRTRAVLIAVLTGAALAGGGGWAVGEGNTRTVTDPATGREVPAPRYGGTLTAASAVEIPNTDQSIGGPHAGAANSGVVEKLGIGNWAIDRAINPLTNRYLDVGHYTGALGGHRRHLLTVDHPCRRDLARQGTDERAPAHRGGCRIQPSAAERQRAIR